jgi:hypothetical protein
MVYDLIKLIFTYDEVNDSEIMLGDEFGEYDKIGFDFLDWLGNTPELENYMKNNDHDSIDLGGFSISFNHFKGFNDKPGIAFMILYDFTLFNNKTEEMRATAYYDRGGEIKEVIVERLMVRNGFLFKIDFEVI